MARELILNVHPTQKQLDMQATLVEASIQIHSIGAKITLMIHVHAAVRIMLKPIDVADSPTVTHIVGLQPIAVEANTVVSCITAGLLLELGPRGVVTFVGAVGGKNLGDNRRLIPAVLPPTHSMFTPSMVVRQHRSDLVIEEQAR